MISEKQVKLINKIASKDTFKYTGEIIQGVDQPADIDYKFTITGHKKMMSVGEYYDYLLLKVVITGVHDPVSKLIFTPQSTDTGRAVARMFESQLYGFYSRLNQEIMNYLRYFNDSDEEFVRTTIDGLSFDFKDSPKLNLEDNKKLRIFVRFGSTRLCSTQIYPNRNFVKSCDFNISYLSSTDGMSKRISMSSLPPLLNDLSISSNLLVVDIIIILSLRESIESNSD